MDWADLTAKVQVMPISLPKAKTAPPVAVGAGDGPALAVGANEHDIPADSDVGNDTQAA